MYHRGNDRSETRRREDYEDVDYRNSSSKKPKSRWDDRDRAPKRDEEEGRKDTSGVSRSRWDSGRSEDVGSVGSSNRWEENRYSSTSHSRLDDKRSRSRSKSPFRRKDDEYSRYSNPSRHGNKESSTNHSSGTGNNSYGGKSSSWSDSSDEGDCKGRPRSNPRDEVKPSQGHAAARSSSNDGGNNPNSSSSGLCLKLTGPGSSTKSAMPLPKILSVSAPIKSTKVASIFNDDDDDEPEEMPAECKMRMKNVGRETKTSEGPNSFGKTKIGFCNLSHLAEKRLEGKGAGKKKP